MTGIPAVLNPWLASTTTAQRRVAVLDAIADAAGRYDVLFAGPASLDENPLVRWIDVPSVPVTVKILLTHPNRGIHLLKIVDTGADPFDDPDRFHDDPFT